MATTTTNFGWDIPQSTDLVKDGATAIAALGQDIDTALVDLKGGTTGQVLAKASNTDLDYTWVAQDDSNAIQNAIVDAKGDLIAASAADTPARLAVGNNGETLVADSSTSTGLRWIPSTVATNPIINSGFDIWQRGTSFTPNTLTYLADRWQMYVGATGTTVTRQTTGDTTNLPFIQYCMRVSRDSGNTGTNVRYMNTPLETTNSIPYAGKTVTLSFYARKGANFSGSLVASLVTGTGTDQNPLVVYTGAATPMTTTPTLTTTWQRFTVTGTLSASATEFCTSFDWTPTGTAGAADYYELTGVQVDVGSVALPYRRNGATLQGELAACQRYYYRAIGTASTNQAIASGISSSATNAFIVLPLMVQMRTAPTVLDYSGLNLTNTSSYTNAVSALTLDMNTPVSVRLSATSTGGTTNQPVQLLFQANGYIGLNAEL